MKMYLINHANLLTANNGIFTSPSLKLMLFQLIYLHLRHTLKIGRHP